MLPQFVAAFCFLAVKFTSAQLPVPLQNNTDVFFLPENLTHIIDGKTYLVEWFTTLEGAHHAIYQNYEPVVCTVINFTEFFFDDISLDGNVTGSGILNVSADFIGYSFINITIYDKENNTLGVGNLHVSVLLSYGKINKIFTYILSALIFIMYINMGATIDLQVVKQIAKKPVGPAVGIFCQYVFMPVIAFGLAKLFFSDNELMQLGLFLNGASPGGGASNMWTLILGGSLDLSIMMTFLSTIVAFGAVPLWVLSLGPLLLSKNSTFVIPYDSIAMIIVSLVLPCGVGLLVQRFLPKAAVFLEKHIMARFAVFNIVFIFTLGGYSHRYVFYYFSWKVVLASFLLPGLGYLSGIALALITRRNRSDTIAISIETGVQNANIAIIILKFTLEHPAADISVVMPTCGFLMTPIPLVVAVIIKIIYKKFWPAVEEEKPTSPPSKEGVENGAISIVELALTDKTPLEQNAKNNNTENGDPKFITHDKMFGVENPTFKPDNDVL